MARKTIISTIAIVLVLVVCIGLLAACKEKVPEFGETTDNYRTMYQIFPYSFADSNGDGIGDLNGITDKLDYIADMNFDGIWLTPVHESPSYHKYDVVDYKSIDPAFGTLEDYDRLVEECHKRGMTIILDLVINHTALDNVWFDKCRMAHVRNRPYDPYYNFYNFSSTQRDDSHWYSAGSGWYYEGQFWSGMPDLNWDYVLNDPDSELGKQLEDVMRFWLIDHNVDGFRLDATGEFFSGNDDMNIRCLEWIDKTAKAIKPDCYIVGEGPWGANAYKYHSSGIDSFFLFTHGYRGDNNISMAGRAAVPGAFSYFAGIDKTDKARIGIYEGSIPALFIANHDTARAMGILQSNISVNNAKMGYAAMVLSCGTTFWYYGDEVGMATFANSAGDTIDENKRQPMPWADEYRCKPVQGTTEVEDSVKYPWGSVQDVLEEKGSLIEFITKANALRRAFPAIARNYGEVIYDDDDCVGIIKKGEGADAVYIVANFSHMNNAEVDLSQYGEFELAATLSVDKTPKLKKDKISMPYMSFAVLKQV